MQFEDRRQRRLVADASFRVCADTRAAAEGCLSQEADCRRRDINKNLCVRFARNRHNGRGRPVFDVQNPVPSRVRTTRGFDCNCVYESDCIQAFPFRRRAHYWHSVVWFRLTPCGVLNESTKMLAGTSGCVRCVIQTITVNHLDLLFNINYSICAKLLWRGSGGQHSKWSCAGREDVFSLG